MTPKSGNTDVKKVNARQGPEMKPLYSQNGGKSVNYTIILFQPSLRWFQQKVYAKNYESEKLNNPRILHHAIGVMQKRRSF
jgi:hypothetical protein